MSKSYLIRNVKVYDGLGGKPYQADVLIQNGKIEKIARETGYLPTVGELIDGSGLCLAPGFIDAHTHSDMQLFFDPSRAGRLLQGITTEIGGQCGSSLSPYVEDMPEDARRYFASDYRTLGWYRTFAEQLEAMDKQPLGCHEKFFVGHRLIRGSVMGMASRPATAKELDRMCGLLEEAMQSGALGISTGLVYSPGPEAAPEELIALAKTAGKYGGMYTTHMRNESDLVEKSVAETLDIGRKSGTPVNISHIKNMYPANWGKTDAILKQLDDALAEGIDVSCDAYPYEACSAGILSTTPPSFRAHGIDWLVEHFRGEENRKLLRELVLEGKEVYENPIRGVGTENELIVRAAGTPDAVGKTIAQYAAEKGIDSFDAWCDIVADNAGSVTDVRFTMKEENIIKFYQHPICMVGSDGLYTRGNELCHPRFFGTMPRYLGRLVRDKKILPFEEGIRRITSMPAKRYGLTNKGAILEGYDADLVLFNENTIIDRADYVHPFLPNEGIKAVFVDGGIAVLDNLYTGLANGRVLRR